MRVTVSAVADVARKSDRPSVRACAAAVALSLCATLAVAGEQGAACKDPAATNVAAITATVERGEKTEPASKACTPADGEKARKEAVEKSADAATRKPDTAGWRRIMAGSGRT